MLQGAMAQSTSIAQPIPYTPDLEQPEAHEAETIRELVDTLLKISTKVYEDGHHALRSVHAKSHALLEGTLRVNDALPAELAQGLFAASGVHPVVLRFSTTPGDWLKDSVSTPRGLAIKVFDVAGPRLPDAAGHTQDFVLVNGPVFAAPDAKHFLKNLKLLAGTTDKSPGLKSALSLALRGVERVIEAVGGESGTLKALGGHPATHPLGETFFTQVPLRYGAHVAKLRVKPASESLRALHGKHIDITHAPNALRDVMREYFAAQSGTWELQVQLCRDATRMPVENAAELWSEELSPFETVGTLTVRPQDAWPEAAAQRLEDGLSFSPWHGIEAHRPLGSVMRARKAAYEASAKFRASRNGVSIDEPAAPPARG